MALVVKDRVQETTTTTGTGTLTLGGAVLGFQTFAVIGNANQTYYAIADPTTGDYEVGIGTYTASGTALSRTTVLESSNSNSLVNFAAGSKNVFCTYPAERAVYLDTAGSAVTLLDIGTLGASTANISTANITSGTVATTPVNNTDIVNKAYADAIASGIHFHEAVALATTTTLPANTYNNGTSGVGATLTGNANGALSVDSTLTVVTERILVKNEAAGANNGVYTVTQVGSAGTPYILTRATDFDTVGTGVDQIDEGDFFLVTSGTANVNTAWVQQTAPPITIGTTAIVFQQFSAPITYTAGTGLSESPSYTFNIANTGTAGTYGGAASVPVFTTNAQGQVTSVTPTGIAIAAAAVSGLAPSATTDTTNASNITSGTLGTSRLSGSYTGVTGVGTLTAGTWNATPIGAVYGGTGQSSYAVGDLVYADTTTSLAKLADVAVGNALISGGVGSAPSYGKIGLATHVSGTLPIANGGTGSTSTQFVDLAANVTGTLPVGNGGTGAATLTANNVLLGNGTSAFQVVAPGTNGNVLQSNGTTWVSASAPSTMVYPGAGIANSTGTSWGTSYSTTGSGTVVALATSPTFVTDVRAPIFYDSNNTAYYGDFASTSNFFDLQITGASNKYLYINPGNGYEAMVRYNGGSGSGWYVGKRGGTDLVGSESFHFYSEAAVRTVAGIDTGGNIFAYGSSRAPIFYDSNDTAFYGDFAGTSRIRKTNLIAIGSGWDDCLNLYSSDQSNRWNLLVDAGASNAFRLAYNNSEALQINTSRNITAIVDFRAPIFYDSNDTTYYVDPNSMSSMFGVAIRGDLSSTGTSNQIFFWGSGNSTTSAIGFKASGGYFPNPTGNGDGYNTYLTMDTDGRGWVFRRGVGGTDFGAAFTSGWILNNGVWQANSSMRAPIFYDSNDTAYYINPANGGFNLRGGTSERVTYLTNDSGYTVSNAEGCGVTVRIGAAWGLPGIYVNPNLYLMSENTIYFHTQNVSRGYMDSSANLIAYGSMRAPIFYDQNNTGYYLDPTSSQSLRTVGDWRSDSSGWTGEFAGKMQYHSNHWYIQYSSNVFFRNASGSNVMECNSSGDLTVSSSSRAPIFYDSNNTGNYLDLTGTSNASMSCLGVWYYKSNYNTSSGNNPPLQAFSDNGSGAVMAFHRNGYYAVNFGLDSDNVMRIGGWSASANLWELDMAGNNTAASSFRAPIFYDTNNTTYYLDPAGSFSFFNSTLALNGNLSMVGTSSSQRIHLAGGAPDASNSGIAAAWNVHSDYRLKENILPVTDGLEKIMQIQIKSFTWKNNIPNIVASLDRQVGVIAHELQEIIPYAVMGQKDAVSANGDIQSQSVDYSKLVSPLIQAVQDLKRIIDEQQTEIGNLKTIFNANF